MCGIQDDKGRGQAILKSPQVPKLKRDLLYHSNLWYAISISKDSSFHRSAPSRLLCFKSTMIKIYLENGRYHLDDTLDDT